MAADERNSEQNFRSKYYKKVGFISVEEKKSIEILLKDNRLDIIKLKQFCLRFTVPASYRNLLWKIFLAILPIYTDLHKFVAKQREQEYEDLSHALKVMRITDKNTPKQQIHHAMWCLENGKLFYDFNIQQENSFTHITQSLLKITDNEVDVYWLAKGLADIIRQFQLDMAGSIEKTYSLLEKEDQLLFKHLSTIGALKQIPVEDWYRCCFAGIITETALVRIWDKLCAGSCKILIFVTVAILITMKGILMEATDLNSVLNCLKMVSEETSEGIVTKAIELWQQHGGALTLQPQLHEKY